MTPVDVDSQLPNGGQYCNCLSLGPYKGSAGWSAMPTELGEVDLTIVVKLVRFVKSRTDGRLDRIDPH